MLLKLQNDIKKMKQAIASLELVIENTKTMYNLTRKFERLLGKEEMLNELLNNKLEVLGDTSR